MSTAAPKLPVTAIVASHNEAHLLERRLHELRSCEEVIVVDIASGDDTAVVAEAHERRVIRHAHVPIAEHARASVAALAHHDWLLLNDPDEEVPEALLREAAEFLRDAPTDVAVVYAPIVYHFAGRPLRGTIWGGTSARPFLVNRARVQLSLGVHETLSLLDGYRSVTFPPGGGNELRHLWVGGYREWIEKHRRYLALEGETRAQKGLVTGYREIARTPWRAFRESFVNQHGYRDGARGFVLSALWAAYSTLSEIALFRERQGRL